MLLRVDESVEVPLDRIYGFVVTLEVVETPEELVRLLWEEKLELALLILLVLLCEVEVEDNETGEDIWKVF